MVNVEMNEYREGECILNQCMARVANLNIEYEGFHSNCVVRFQAYT